MDRMIRLPKPLRGGGFAGGPPLCCHTFAGRGRALGRVAEPGTIPAGFDAAPGRAAAGTVGMHPPAAAKRRDPSDGARARDRGPVSPERTTGARSGGRPRTGPERLAGPAGHICCSGGTSARRDRFQPRSRKFARTGVSMCHDPRPARSARITAPGPGGTAPARPGRHERPRSGRPRFGRMEGGIVPRMTDTPSPAILAPRGLGCSPLCRPCPMGEAA